MIRDIFKELIMKELNLSINEKFRLEDKYSKLEYGTYYFNENLLLVEIRTETEYLAQDDVYAILIDDRYRIIKEGESNMLYTLTEEEFKVYRECRSEIIKIYNQMTDIYLTGNEAIDRNVEKYSKILGVEKGKKYNGI